MSAYRPAQGGFALFFALVMLLVMTLIGVSAVDSSNLNLKVATSDKNRQLVFQAAEATLTIAEQRLHDSAPDDTVLEACASGSADCFDAVCAGGLCFNGSYAAADSQFDCSVAPLATEVWRNPTLNVWATNGKHQTAKVNGLKKETKYLVEFLCFVNRGDGSTFDADNPDNGASLFRVTALAESDDGKAQVMLQSTYRYTE